MNQKLKSALDRVKARTARVGQAASEHRFWVQLGLLTLFALTALGAWGRSSRLREDAYETRTAELRRVDAAYDRWVREVRLPAPAESLTWRGSEAALADLGQESTRSVTIARLIASRAGEVGVSNLRVSLAGAENVVNLETVVLGGWEARPAGEGVVVEFDATFGGVMAFLAALPVQAAVSEINLTDAGGILHARIVIGTRRIQRNG